MEIGGEELEDSVERAEWIGEDALCSRIGFMTIFMGIPPVMPDRGSSDMRRGGQVGSLGEKVSYELTGLV